MTTRALARRLLNGAWIAACSREQARFNRALARVADTQTDYLLALLRRNAETRFGTKHGFARIRSVAEYQNRVPVTPYEALAPQIEAIARGEAAVLTADPVRLFQPTSGSISETKLIPWTATAAREFRRGIAPWLAALYKRKPGLLHGTAYWSVSPPATPLQTHGRLPVGFEHDAEYLGFLGRKLFSLVNSVPPDVARCHDILEFKARTLASLLADEDLSLISVWSPTFLTTLLEDFLPSPTCRRRREESLIRREEIFNALRQSGRPGARRRAEFLQSLAWDSLDGSLFGQVWPKLQLISCWTHGPSELYAGNLRRFFPAVEIQGKGLVATEAFVSLPFHEDHDPVLAVTAHFFEFQDPTSEKLFLAHELNLEGTYRVIVTTGSGLYRYPLGDLVRVTGFIGDAPCLRFVGREGNVSDLFGEKLHGPSVEALIRRVLAQESVNARFFLLAPAADAAAQTAYTLFLEADTIPDPARLRQDLENGLAENFHYAHCRRLGQLSEARVFQIARNTLPPETLYHQEMLSRGLKLGDIKMLPLDPHLNWNQRFQGKFLAF